YFLVERPFLPAGHFSPERGLDPYLRCPSTDQTDAQKYLLQRRQVAAPGLLIALLYLLAHHQHLAAPDASGRPRVGQSSPFARNRGGKDFVAKGSETV
ncbi:uncharacterized protein METZ01_LOCUS516097, partial [marine metagenome]